MFLKIFIQKYGWTLTAIEADCGRATEVTGFLLEGMGPSLEVVIFQAPSRCTVEIRKFQRKIEENSG